MAVHADYEGRTRGWVRAVAVAAIIAAIPMARAWSAGHPQQAHSEVRLDNEFVRVVENRYPPGAESPVHSHAHARVVYVVEGGTMELVPEEGETVRLEATAGQTMWRPAETHAVRNVGASRVVVVETEIKPR